MTTEYQCDQCGACCIYLTAVVYGDDLVREPRIALYVLGRESTWKVGDGIDEKHYMGGEPENGCPMLTEHGTCSCYKTRPSVCERFEPGGQLCQYARGRAGLELLYPTTVKDK